MQSVKNLCLNLRSRFLKKDESIERVTLSYSEAQNIGILAYAETPQYEELLEQIVSQLTKDGKNVTVLVFAKSDPQEGEQESPFPIFTLKSVDLLGNIKDEGLTNFTATTFDLLYCISNEITPLINYLLQTSRAKCRLGFHSEGVVEQDLFEFMVDLEEDDTNLKKHIDALLSYSKSFNQVFVEV